MLFGKSKDSIDPNRFWKDREEELGTEVLEKALGQVVQKENSLPLWGLFYTTKDAVYFQTFKSENWLSMLFTGGRGKGRSQDETIEIPRETILKFEVLKQKKRIFSFFRKAPVVELAWKDALSGNENRMLFEMEGNAEALVASLPR